MTACAYVAETHGKPCGREATHDVDGRALCTEHFELVDERRRVLAERDTYDPCPEGHPGVTDIGHGVRIRMTTYGGVTAGLIESHPRPDTGARCSGAVTFDLVETVGINHKARWSVLSRDPLTLDPSLLCRACGHHGYIRDGRWVPA